MLILFVTIFKLARWGKLKTLRLVFALTEGAYEGETGSYRGKVISLLAVADEK